MRKRMVVTTRIYWKYNTNVHFGIIDHFQDMVLPCFCMSHLKNAKFHVNISPSLRSKYCISEANSTYFDVMRAS